MHALSWSPSFVSELASLERAVVKRYIVLGAVVLCAGVVGYWANPRRVFAQRITLTPFTAEFARNQYRPGGTPDARPATHFKYYRRDDGSRATTISGDGTLTTIVDASRLEYTMLETSTLSKITFRYPSLERLASALNLNEEGQCPALGGPVELLESADERFGQQIVHRRIREEKIKGFARSTREEWVVPALNCFSLETVATDTTGARAVTKVTSLEVGPPAAAAFEIPSAYVERSPIAMEQEYKTRFAKAYWGDKVSEVMERNYWKLR